MSMDGQGTKLHRNIAENFNRLSTAHERYRRQTTDGRTTSYGRQLSRSRSIIIQNAQLSQRDGAAGCVRFGKKCDWNWETIFY